MRTIFQYAMPRQYFQTSGVHRAFVMFFFTVKTNIALSKGKRTNDKIQYVTHCHAMVRNKPKFREKLIWYTCKITENTQRGNQDNRSLFSSTSVYKCL